MKKIFELKTRMGVAALVVALSGLFGCSSGNGEKLSATKTTEISTASQASPSPAISTDFVLNCSNGDSFQQTTVGSGWTFTAKIKGYRIDGYSNSCAFQLVSGNPAVLIGSCSTSWSRDAAGATRNYGIEVYQGDVEVPEWWQNTSYPKMEMHRDTIHMVTGIQDNLVLNVYVDGSRYDSNGFVVGGEEVTTLAEDLKNCSN